MAWNNSESSGSAPSAGRGATALPRVGRGLAAGLIVAAGAGLALWLLVGRGGGDAAAEKEQPKAETKIAEAKPSAAPTNRVEAAKKQLTPQEKRLAEIKYFEDKFGTNMPPGIKAHVYFLKHPPSVYRPKTEYGYLRHPAERQIASLLTVEPGTFMLAKPEFGESFNKSFLNSMLDKTEILETDDEEVRAVKEFVATAKKEIIAQQKAAGKLPNEVMNEHAAILYELGQYEQSLEKELVAVKNDPEVSDQEIEDLFAAANKMRKAKGLAERPIPDFSKRSIRLQKKLMKKGKK